MRNPTYSYLLNYPGAGHYLANAEIDSTGRVFVYSVVTMEGIETIQFLSDRVKNYWAELVTEAAQAAGHLPAIANNANNQKDAKI